MSIRSVTSVTKLVSKTSPRTCTLAVGHSERSYPAFLLGARWSSSEATSDDEIKRGSVEFFNVKKHYGLIKPDDGEKNIIVHSNAIKTIPVEGEQIFPRLSRRMRVQFKVGPRDDGGVQALEVTLEGGKLVPPFRKNYLEGYINSLKSRFGHDVFDIMDSTTDQQDMETEIVSKFENTKNSITRQKAKVEKVLEVYDSAA